MFRRIFKSREPSGEKSSAQEEAIAVIEEPDEDTDEAEDILVTKITNLEELVSKRTKDLEEAKELLNQLSEPVENAEEGEAQAKEPLAQPHQPESELTVPTEEEPSDEGKDLNVSMEKKEGEEDGSFSSLFSQGEEEENLLARLITSLPDVTAEEILGEAKKLQTMLSEQQRS